MNVEGKSLKENDAETKWTEQGRNVPTYSIFGSPSQDYAFHNPIINAEKDNHRRRIRSVFLVVSLILICLVLWIYIAVVSQQVSNYWSLIIGVLTGAVLYSKNDADKFEATAGYLVFVGSGLGLLIVSLMLITFSLHVSFEELRKSLGLFMLVKASVESLKVFDVFVFLVSIVLALFIANFRFLKHFIRPKHEKTPP